MMKRLSMIASTSALVALLMIQASAKEITVRGHLEPTVEAGGWLIVSDTDEMTTKYLLLNSQRFKNESWFREGAQVEATGETKPDAVTIYQQGIPFEARTMSPIESKGNEIVNDKRLTRRPRARTKVVRLLAPSKRRRPRHRS
jgi:homoaconitase/3-isopropylmalate dehydratase large subunit